MKDFIEFSEFLEIGKKIEIRIGKVLNSENVIKSKKLIKLEVDFGTEIRTVVTNLINIPLVGQKFAFVTNLKPVKIMGIESTAMILPGDETEKGSVVTINSDLGISLL